MPVAVNYRRQPITDRLPIGRTHVLLMYGERSANIHCDWNSEKLQMAIEFWKSSEISKLYESSRRYFGRKV
jgi:hypothetical protein